MSTVYAATTMFQHTAARRRLVSKMQANYDATGFNTQPPEGGWIHLQLHLRMKDGFNTQPPEGGWHARYLPIFYV